MRTFVFVLSLTAIALGAGSAGFRLGQQNSPSEPPKTHELSGHHDRDIAEFKALQFPSYLRAYLQGLPPDVPRTIEFPEIATNPVLWDFTLHSVLRGEKRTWTWGDVGYVTASTSGTAVVIGTAPATSTWTWSGGNSGSSPAYTVFPALIPAASGGRP